MSCWTSWSPNCCLECAAEPNRRKTAETTAPENSPPAETPTELVFLEGRSAGASAMEDAMLQQKGSPVTMAEMIAPRFVRVPIAALLLGFWLSLGGCSTPGQTAEENHETGQGAQAVERIRGLVRMWAADLNRGNTASAVSIYSPGVMYMPPGQPPLQGPDQVRQFLQKLFPAGKASLSYSSQETQVSGDLAYERGVFVLTSGDAGTRGASRNGNLMRVFRRSEDGAWKVTREIWNVSLESSGTEREGAPPHQ